MTNDVVHDRELLCSLLKDAARQSDCWQPGARWATYDTRIASELLGNELGSFRRNHQLVKGFAPGGVPRPIPRASTARRVIWQGLVRIPGVSRILQQYDHLLGAQHGALVKATRMHARLALDRLLAEFPQLVPLEGTVNGGAEDLIEWDGIAVSAHWVEHLWRVADFYRRVDSKTVKSVLEIGPGLGFSTLAHIAFNPHLKTVVNVDIVPVLYLATQFLKSTGCARVVDYREIHSAGGIKQSLGDNGQVTIFQLPPWEMPNIDIEFDLFLNAASMQEMTEPIIENYIRHVNRLVRGYCFLLMGDPDIPADGDAVPARYIRELLKTHFPHRTKITDGWSEIYERSSYVPQLLCSGSA